jgi:predicted nuclease of restriction endonuclease-like (RecB) superfamily
MTGQVQPSGYGVLLESIKREIAGSRLRAARAVSTELVGMHWRIGGLILDRQAEQGWGTAVIDRLSTDLRTSFPGSRGFSRRNLHYMRALAEAWPQVVPQPVAQLPWGHVRVLLDRIDDRSEREWYAARDAEEGWSRAVLETMIASRLHLRQAAAPSNFATTLPRGDSDLAQEITRDPYVFDFVRLEPGYRELDLQAALLRELRRLLQELGPGSPSSASSTRWLLGTVSSSSICSATTPGCTGMWSSNSSSAASTRVTSASCSSMSRRSMERFATRRSTRRPSVYSSSPTGTRRLCSTRCSPPPLRWR